MRTIQLARAGGFVAALAACLLVAGAARADVATERPGSLLIFPKVVQAENRETVIQLTNTGNMAMTLRCFYLNGQRSVTGRQLCDETDFVLDLTKQQPTHWNVSEGRNVNPLDSTTGLDPGFIPPVPPGFTGALLCVSVDAAEKPLQNNSLKGEATIVDVSSPNAPDESKYNAIAVQGRAVGNNNDLDLNDTEFDACPSAAVVGFTPDAGRDPVIEALGNGGTCVNNGVGCNNDGQCSGPSGACVASACTNAGAVGRECTDDADCGVCTTGQSRVRSRLTVLPCNLDLATATPTALSLKFFVYNEFEQRLSTGQDISCWASLPLAEIGAVGTSQPGVLGYNPPFATQFETVRVISSSGGPFVAIAESLHSDATAMSASEATNVHVQGICSIVGPLAPVGCNADTDCPEGQTCNLTTPATIRLPDQFPGQ